MAPAPTRSLGRLERRAGVQPFRELACVGRMPLGTAALTSAGRLPYAGIIHVAGINLLWRASERSIREGVRHAIALAEEQGYARVGLPIIGAGSGGFDEARALALIEETLRDIESKVQAIVVRYRRRD